MATRDIAHKLYHGQNSIFEVMGDIRRTRKQIDHILTEKLEVLGLSFDGRKALIEYKQELDTLELYARKQSCLVQRYLDSLDF